MNTTKNDILKNSTKVDDVHINKESKQLDVVKAQFEGVNCLSLDEMINGYDELYAITYSSSVDFICKLVKNFKYSEIIFGYDEIISYKLHEILAFQSKMMEKLRYESKKASLDLVNKIENNELKLYVADTSISHEKVYILKNSQNQKRIITGSPNMSNAAFYGHQMENIICFDDDKAYDWYFGRFKSLKEQSVSYITKEALLYGNSDSDLDKLPIAHKVKDHEPIIFTENNDLSDLIKFTFEVKNLSRKLKSCLPMSHNGRTELSYESLKEIRNKRVTNIHQEKKERYFPLLGIHVWL